MTARSAGARAADRWRPCGWGGWPPERLVSNTDDSAAKEGNEAVEKCLEGVGHDNGCGNDQRQERYGRDGRQSGSEGCAERDIQLDKAFQKLQTRHSTSPNRPHANTGHAAGQRIKDQ